MLQRKTLASGGPWCRTHVRCWKKSYSAIEHSVHRVGGRPYNLEVQEVIQSLLKEKVLLLVPPKSQWPIRNYEIKNSNHNNLKSNFSLTFHRFDWGSGRIPPIPRRFRGPYIQYIVNCMKRGRPHNGSSKRPFLKGAKNYRVSYNLDVAPNTRTLIQKWRFNQKFKLRDNFRIAFVITS